MCTSNPQQASLYLHRSRSIQRIRHNDSLDFVSVSQESGAEKTNTTKGWTKHLISVRRLPIEPWKCTKSGQIKVSLLRCVGTGGDLVFFLSASSITSRVCRIHIYSIYLSNRVTYHPSFRETWKKKTIKEGQVYQRHGRTAEWMWASLSSFSVMRVCRRMHVCTQTYAAYENTSQQKKCDGCLLQSWHNTKKIKDSPFFHIVDIQACNINRQIKLIK